MEVDKSIEALENGKQNPVPFEEALVLTGQGKFHIALQFICGLTLMTTIIETLCTGYILPSAQCDLQLSTQDKGILNAVCYIGMISSSHLWGFLADTKGRRDILIVSLLLDAMTTVLSSFSHSFWLLLIFRFFSGFFICGPSAVLFAYMGEFHSERTRARAIVWLGVFVAIATLILPGMAWVIIPLPLSFELPWATYRTWRLFLVVCTLPGFLSAILMRIFLPRSPKFLLVSGKEDEALAVLRKMYAWNSGDKPENFPVKHLLMDKKLRSNSIVSFTPVVPKNKSAVELLKSMWRQTAPLLFPPYLLNITLTCSMLFAIFSCCNGVLLWLPEIFNRLSEFSKLHPNESYPICETIAQSINRSNYNNTNLEVLEIPRDCSSEVNPRVFENTLVIGTATAGAYIIAGYIVPMVGKRNVLMGSMMISGVAGIALQFMETADTILAVSCIFIALSMTCVSVTNSVVVDLFPTQLRAMAVCLSLMFGRLGTCVGSVLVGTLLELSCSLVFYVLGGLIFGCGLLACIIPKSNQQLPIT